MKKRYTEEQIIGFLREADAGLPVKELCRKHGFSEPSYYAWKAKFGGMNVSDAQRLKALEAENGKLKRLAGQLDARARRDARGAAPKVVAVAARREVVRQLQGLGLSERQALRLVGMSASTLRYQPRDDGNESLRERLKELAGQHRRHGYRMLHSRLRIDGWAINVKRTYRVYREEGLMVRKRRRKKLPVPERQPLVRPMQPNEVWSMDFLFDELANGRRVKALTVVDDCSKEVVQIVADTSIPALYVTRVLDQVSAERGLPRVIRTDNGPEFAGRVDADMGGAQPRRAALHPARQAGTERLHRELQQPLPRRVPVAALVRQPQPHAQRHRQLARRLQPPPAAQHARLRAAGHVRREVPPARWRHLATHRIHYDAKPWALDRSATKLGGSAHSHLSFP